jgi:uncharacterized membrane protein (DUF106 family)
MALLNRGLGAFFDLLVLPFRGMPAAVGLTVISLLVAVGILLAFRRTSDQDALERVKRRIQAGIYEIRLYKDDLRTIFTSQYAILGHTWTYFKLSMVPMLWIMLPIVVVVIQLQFQYGYASVEPGDPVLVIAQMTEEEAGRVAGTDASDVVLEAPEGVRVETPAVWSPALGEVAWRVRAEAAGEHELVVRVGDGSFTKSLRVSGTTVRRSPVRPAGLLGQMVYPAEPPLPDGSGLASIRIDYADGEVSLLGFEMHWIIAFFILTMIFAFALARPLGINI